MLLVSVVHVVHHEGITVNIPVDIARPLYQDLQQSVELIKGLRDDRAPQPLRRYPSRRSCFDCMIGPRLALDLTLST
jgi:hypothetical protein